MHDNHRDCGRACEESPKYLKNPPGCNCSASEPDAAFPNIHATDCPEFIKPFQKRFHPEFGVTTSPSEDFTEAMGFWRWNHRAKAHLCCWLWKAALVIPLLHLVMHLLGLPHPEVLTFIP